MKDKNDIVILDFEKPVYELMHKIDDLKKESAEKNINLNIEIKKLDKKLKALKRKIYLTLTPWQITQIARHPNRPFLNDYIEFIFDEFIELHGDRCYGDDKAIIGGLARLNGQRVIVIGHQKGRTTEDNMYRNFGLAHPEGYRKALRLMELAEKFKIPVITFVDTQGAFPGIGAEERGQAEAIAKNLQDVSLLEIPIITVIVGEGGSGGALGIAVADKVVMLENSMYSVISPEGCASILWRDASKASDAASALCLTAKDLYRFGIIDEIIKEPLGGAHYDFDTTMKNVKNSIIVNLNTLKRVAPMKLVSMRYKRIRNLGEFEENGKRFTSKRFDI